MAPAEPPTLSTLHSASGFGKKSSRTESIVRALRSRFSASKTYGLFFEKLYWYPRFKMAALALFFYSV